MGLYRLIYFHKGIPRHRLRDTASYTFLVVKDIDHYLGCL